MTVESIEFIQKFSLSLSLLALSVYAANTSTQLQIFRGDYKNVPSYRHYTVIHNRRPAYDYDRLARANTHPAYVFHAFIRGLQGD